MWFVLGQRIINLSIPARWFRYILSFALTLNCSPIYEKTEEDQQASKIEADLYFFTIYESGYF